MNDPTGIDSIELASRIGKGDPLALLDVREPVEREFCKIRVTELIPDLHIPMSEVSARLDEIKTAATERTLVVYCHHGVRSGMVAGWLRHQWDADVLNLEGGIDDWSTAVDPIIPRY